MSKVSYNARCIYGGYYEYRRHVIVDERLELMPNAQAGIEYDNNNNPKLISYETVVCFVDDSNLLRCSGTYSATTRKHIVAFLKQFYHTLSYYDMKYCYEYECGIDINSFLIISLETGEVFTNWKDAIKDYKLRHKK